LKVLRQVNLEIKPGKITAVLGPNGSGKTTLIKSILGLVKPDTGDLTHNGISIIRNDKFRNNMGYMPQTGHFPENLRINELFRLVADLRSSPIDPEYFINYFSLISHCDKPLSELSGGTRQKVSAILAFIFDPQLIILDEPTVGLDPVAGIQLKNLMIDRKDKGKTILFTSHIIPTVEDIADEIVFLLEGRIKFVGTVAEMKDTFRNANLEQAIVNLLNREVIK
jgi:Cu-processing system ATP-binding protein